jgi:hypothetical protein
MGEAVLGAPGFNEMPRTKPERMKLLTLHPPLAADVVIAALGGARYGEPGMPPLSPWTLREVVVNRYNEIELWETRQVLADKE